MLMECIKCPEIYYTILDNCPVCGAELIVKEERKAEKGEANE